MTVHEHAVELGPLADARAQLREAVDVLGYDDGMYEMLAAPRREMTVSIPLRRDDGTSSCSPGTACSTTSRAARPRAACVPPRTSTWTRSARWRCG